MILISTPGKHRKVHNTVLSGTDESASWDSGQSYDKKEMNSTRGIYPNQSRLRIQIKFHYTVDNMTSLGGRNVLSEIDR